MKRIVVGSLLLLEGALFYAILVFTMDLASSMPRATALTGFGHCVAAIARAVPTRVALGLRHLRHG